MGVAGARARSSPSPAAFLIIPTFYLVTGSFRTESGQPTLQNYADLSQPTIVEAFRASIEISVVTAVIGGIFGFLLAYAVIRGGLPRFLGAALMTFSGVASNFAGVPLALAFTFTLGATGLVTLLLHAARDRPEERRLHDLLEARPRDRVPLLPVPVDGPDHGAGHPGPQDGVARGIGEHGRQHLPVLAAHRAADPDADAARDDDPAVRQCVRRAGDGLHADR